MDVLECMAHFSYFNKIEFNFAIDDSLEKSTILQLLNKRKWQNLKTICKNNGLKYKYKFIKVNFHWNSFEEVLVKSKFVVSMAGTAT